MNDDIEFFFLSQDGDGHWFIVPEEKEIEWHDWLDLDPDDEEAWIAPDWAIEVGGSYTMVKFSEYRID